MVKLIQRKENKMITGAIKDLKSVILQMKKSAEYYEKYSLMGSLNAVTKKINKIAKIINELEIINDQLIKKKSPIARKQYRLTKF